MTTARPFLMFQGGNAQAALDLYFATFPDSGMVRVERYSEGELGPVGTIKVAVFTLCGVARHEVGTTPLPRTRDHLSAHGAVA